MTPTQAALHAQASPSAAATAVKGALRAHKWLLLRRLSQLGLLALFLAGPWAGIWIVKGSLASSLTLDVLPLSDPYIVLQGLLAGHAMAASALIGAGIVAIFYAVAGGRVFCSWACPVNLVTDAAAWLRRALGLRAEIALPRKTRTWLLGLTLVLAASLGVIAWEWVNPVTMFHRGLVFGLGLAWAVVLAVFLLDLLVAPRAWCGHLCPVGAFYALLGAGALLRVSARSSSRCDDCLDCYRVCPEPQVITPALKGGDSPVIRAGACTNCGRCVDVCHKDVFRFTLRFDQRRD
jgi:ferredoxin-type protein NapH